MEEFILKIKKAFPYLTDTTISKLMSLGEIQVLQEGETFIKQGERHNRIALVMQGLLRNYIMNDNGEQITVVFATELQSIAPYKCLFLQQPASETTEAVKSSMLITFDYPTMRKLGEEEPEFNKLYMDALEKTLMNAIERVEDFTIAKPEERYQRLLAKHGYLIEQAPLKYLASYLGINPVSLSRIRKRISTGKKK
ncbi:MAG TPA: Crp/Fnr family transcriptional regulator [Chitinophagales bacterium]|nr:Crp/Fnr family transcriptional regulator [Chitinophagales bacterium]